ncbi:MAG: fructose-6-phosphate aldolase [Christensenellaceae bacterium]|jgi:transaldolase|nr:fructose-6-phosphate aldolase [Christensenellaceae bacterium]
MRLFVDSANLRDIETAFDMGIISGVTTNPVLIHKECPENKLKQHIQSIRSICDGEILTQVVGSTAKEMVRQAKEINSWDSNITVKIPLVREGIKAVSMLQKEGGIRTCNTITFNAGQALAAAMAGATYISPFYNRANKDTNCGLQMMEAITQIFRVNALKTKILVASIDKPMDVVNLAMLGVDVITAPLPVWEGLFENTLTDAVLAKFLKDWKGDEI